MNRIMLFIAPVALMILAAVAITGVEHWLSAFGKTEAARQVLGRTGISVPYLSAALIGIVFLFASAGAIRVKTAGWGVVAGGVATILIAAFRETIRLSALTGQVPAGKSIIAYVDPATLIGAGIAAMATCFALGRKLIKPLVV